MPAVYEIYETSGNSARSVRRTHELHLIESQLLNKDQRVFIPKNRIGPLKSISLQIRD